jgi:hypothetical protein
VSDNLVPAGFLVPDSFDGPGFRFEPLGPQHNDRDYAAWTSSMEHILATPGFTSNRWPRPMSIDDNLQDLVGHADDFRSWEGFTYSILDVRDLPTESHLQGGHETSASEDRGGYASLRAYDGTGSPKFQIRKARGSSKSERLAEAPNQKGLRWVLPYRVRGLTDPPGSKTRLSPLKVGRG